MTLLIASVFPVVIFLYMIYQKDHEKEPISLLLKCLFGGCLSILLSLFMSLPVGILIGEFQGNFLSSLQKSFLLAAIPEEVAKFVMLYLFVWKSRELNHHYDGIIYSVFVSLGFALIENILYVFQGGFGIAFMRAVLAVPGHGFHTGEKRKEFLIKSLVIPIIFHGAYDFILFYMSVSDNVFLAVFLLIAFAVFVILLWRKGLTKIKQHLERDGKVLISEQEARQEL